MIIHKGASVGKSETSCLLAIEYCTYGPKEETYGERRARLMREFVGPRPFIVPVDDSLILMPDKMAKGR